MLSQSLLTPASLARLFINPEFRLVSSEALVPIIVVLILAAGCVPPRCIERPGVLIPGINRMQPATMTSPDVYDYYDV